MLSLNDTLPEYLSGKMQLVGTVLFATFFSIVFMLVSVPFSHNAWFELGTSEAFGYTVAFCMIALAVVIASKCVFYRVRTHVRLTFGIFLMWDVVEVVVICLLYTFFSFRADKAGVISLQLAPLSLFLNSLVYCSVSVGVPYVLSGMYFALLDRDNTIRLLNYGNVITDENYLPQNEKKISLFDNSGNLKMSINSHNLYFIESNDNYIRVWYKDSKGDMKQYMLRCRLKTVEDSFSDSSLVRCHRKYIVNMDHVRVLSRVKESYLLELDDENIEPVPVSRTYEKNVLGRFNSR